MIYRVDYLLAVMFVGAIAGALFSRRASRIESERLARGYFVAVAVVLGLRAVAFGCSTVLGHGTVWVPIGGALDDVWNFLFGALCGLAPRRANPNEFWREPAIYSALCLSVGVFFVLSGFAKAFYMHEMIEFFMQSGYSMPFLRFIMTAEVFGGIGLLVPWMVLPATAGLSIDMFGAVYTHVHNGDPIHDSTGAIGMLIRLGTIAALWVLRRRSATSAGLNRKPFFGIAVGAVICITAAVTGSVLLRRPPASSAAPPVTAANQFDYFLGTWSCAGTFTKSGAVVEADLHFEKTLDGKWLLFRHDDRPPNHYHALAEWNQGEHEWTATIQDSFGGLRLFHAAGWQGNRLVWEGNAIADPATITQRFVFERTDSALFRVSYETQQSGAWHEIDVSSCTLTSR